ncbi:MAG TPA: LPXTG cell wall anchor domain-containing protein [Natronosporangium sp.]
MSSALIGLLGGIILAASPAAAQTSTVTGSCGWDGTAAEWVVTWTVTTDPPAGATAFRWLAVEATPSPVAGIEATPAGEFPHRAGQQLVGEQRLPEGTTSASLTVQAEWDNGQQDAEPSRGELQLPADCSRGDLISQWRLDCDAVTITIQNPTAEPVTVTLVPNAGNPVPVQVAGGEAATVEFPPSPGLSVDVRVGEQSIVDPGDPIAVTAGQVAALECAAEQDGGGGGGLPATGTSALIVAAGALALLALGAGLYLIARRRRIRFTA